MDPSTFEQQLNFDEATKMAHVQLHRDDAKVRVFPVDEEATAREHEAEEGDGDGKGRLRVKLKEAIASKFKNNAYQAMVSYVVDNKIKDLSTALQIRADDLNLPPLVISGKSELEELKDAKKQKAPDVGFKVITDKETRIAPKSRRLKQRQKERIQEGRQIALLDNTPDKNAVDEIRGNLQLMGVPFAKAVPGNFNTAINDAKAEGIPVWEKLLEAPELNQGRRRSNSTPTYHNKTTPKPDSKEVTANLRETANQHVATELVKKDGMNIRPDSDEIMAELHKFLANRPQYRGKEGQLNKVHINTFRDWMRYSKKMLASSHDIEQLIYRKYQIVPTGLIPVAEDACAQEIQDAAHFDSLRALPKLRDGDKEEKEELTEEQKREMANRKLEEKAHAFRRIAPIAKDIHELMARKKVFTQDEDNRVNIQMVEQPELTSFLRIRHSLHYRDADVPDKQPSRNIYIDLTYNNTNGRQGEEGKDIDYYNTHRVVDVSDPAWQPYLEKIFPQTKKHEDYFVTLYGSVKVSGLHLYLITFKHNEKHCTGNLMTRQEDVTALNTDLRTVIEAEPAVFVLVRADDDLPIHVQTLVDRFVDLTRYNPLNEFFEQPKNPSLSDTGIKKMEELPVFTAFPQAVYDVWQTYSQQLGIAGLLEQRFSMGTHIYDATVAVVPIPATFLAVANVFMSYHLQASIKYDEDKPRLMPGDTVIVEFEPRDEASSASEKAWKGRVSEPTQATPMGASNIIVERPIKDGELLDDKEHSIITMNALGKMSAPQLIRWCQDNFKVKIKIFAQGDAKECKRLMNNVRAMELPESQRETHEEKGKILEAARNTLLCTNHLLSTTTPLYDDVLENRDASTTYIQEVLRPHQKEIYDKWMMDGVYDKTIWLTGPSGSGKTYLAAATVLPYLNKVTVERSIVNIMNKDKEVAYQKTAKKREEKDKGKVDQNDGWDKAGIEQVEETETATDPTTDPTADPTDEPTADAEESAPTKGSADSDAKQMGDVEIEHGRITMLAMQNESVDAEYVLMKAMAEQYAKDMCLPKPMVLRMHGRESELAAVRAMTHPLYNPNEHKPRFNVDTSVTVTEEVPMSLLNAYLAAYRGGSPWISDRRLKHVDGAAARYILQLARFPGFDVSQELRDTFSAQEREEFAKSLKPVIKGHQMKRTPEGINVELKIQIAQAAKAALEALLERAAVVCTTVSVGTQMSFNMIRRAHAVVLEEAGRANDTETVGILSQYWNCGLKILGGATNQLRPMAFGNPKQNPFQKTLEMATIARLEATGGDVNRLLASSRYRNQQLFDLCATVNDMPTMVPVQGAFDDASSQQYANINKKIWKIDSNLIFLNTVHTTEQRDANRSTYCLETAAVAIKDAVERVQYIEGKHHVIITPYNAQVGVLRRERDFAAYTAHTRRQTAIAKKLMDIEITTIDSFMGKDRESVTVDTAGVIGHLFEYGRTVVAATRARTSCQFIGPTMNFTAPTAKVNAGHPFTKVIRGMDQKGQIRRITLDDIKTFEQYQTAMKVIGFDVDEITPVAKKASITVLEAYGQGPPDKDELEIIKLMEQIKPEQASPADDKDEDDNTTTSWTTKHADKSAADDDDAAADPTNEEANETKDTVGGTWGNDLSSNWEQEVNTTWDKEVNPAWDKGGW